MLFCSFHLVKVQSILVYLFSVPPVIFKEYEKQWFHPNDSSLSHDDSAAQDRTEPVDDLQEGDEAEAEEEAKHASQRGEEVCCCHLRAPLVL